MLKRPNQLREVMVDQIRTFGQLKMDKYWNLALTDPQYGYYRKGNVFSTEGDFTTSPEISPLFGEMVTTWIVYFLQTVKIMRGETGSLNRNVRIIQLGAGRGLLMRDIVRLFRDFKIDNHFEINFVESIC